MEINTVTETIPNNISRRNIIELYSLKRKKVQTILPIKGSKKRHNSCLNRLKSRAKQYRSNLLIQPKITIRKNRRNNNSSSRLEAVVLSNINNKPIIVGITNKRSLINNRIHYRTLINHILIIQLSKKLPEFESISNTFLRVYKP